MKLNKMFMLKKKVEDIKIKYLMLKKRMKRGWGLRDTVSPNTVNEK